MWLDDLRPAPSGWVHVYTAEEAKVFLEQNRVSEASLDHDLGMCDSCVGAFDGISLHCRHRKSGYDLVLWMAEFGIWPEVVHVHSMNPVGRQNMLQIITRYKP